MNPYPLLRVALIVSLTILSLARLHAAAISVANTSSALNLGTSWVGGTAPTSSDTAVFDSTVTVSRNVALGGSVSWGGIQVLNPGGTYTIGATSGAVLTLGSGGIDMSAATADFTIAAVMDLTASQTWTVSSGRTLAISGANTGSGSLTLAGAGAFNLANNAALGTTAVTFGDGITLTNTNARVLTNAATLAGNMTVSLSGTASLVLGGGMTIGSGTQTIYLSNSTATWSAGTHMLAFYGASGLSGLGTLVFENANAGDSPMLGVQFGNSSSNDGFTVSSDITVGGGVELSMVRSSILTSSVALTVEAGGRLNLSAGGGGVTNQTIRSLSGAGTVTKDASSTATGSSMLTIDGGSTTSATTFSGVIQDGTGAIAASGTGTLGITKTGSTTQTFSGADTYSGQTLVQGGRLFVDGTHIQSTAMTGVGYQSGTQGNYLVSSGATLGGSGRISGDSAVASANMILVQSGGTLAPGSAASIGTFILDGANITGSGSHILSMASGAAFSFTLAGNVSDQLALWNYSSGKLVLNSNAINLDLAANTAAGTYTVTLFSFYSDSGTTLVGSGLSSGLVLGSLGSDITDASISYDGSTINLTYTVASTIPEPASVAMIFGVFAAAVCFVRHHRRA